MIRRPPRSTPLYSSAASDVYKRQVPFATTIWTTYPDTTAGVLFFHCVMFITGFILYANWSYVKRRKHLLKKDIAMRTLRTITFRTASLPIASALAIALA